MALRSHSATSGPGRAPASDVRARRGHGHRRRLRRAAPETPAAMALRRRAEALFEADPLAAPRASTVAVGSASLPVLPTPDPEIREPGLPYRPNWARRPGARPGVGDGDSASPELGVSSVVPGPDAAADARDDRDDRGDGVGGGGGEPGAVVARGARLRMALRERLPVWVQSRCGLEPKSLAALAVVLVVAAVFAAQHFWAGRPEQVRPPERVGERPTAVVPGPAPGLPPMSPTGPSEPSGTGVRIVVDVSGKVRQPGVRRLPAGSRVADALRAAGGVKDGANTTGLNRARLLIDGEQVVVGAPAPPPGVPAGPGATGAAGAPVVGGATAAGPVTLSTATVEQLETLPGVGPVLAQHIVDYRTQHGGFRSIGELREVNGIGDRRFADIQPLVRP